MPKIQLFKTFGMVVTENYTEKRLKFGIFIYIHKDCNFTKYH